MNSRRSAAMGSAVFLAAMPGVVAGMVPWAITGWDADGHVPALAAAIGVALIVAGAGVLLHAFGRFVMEGVGTPAPVAPTRELVVGGLYRYVRNPMYLAVGSVIAGQAIVFGDLGLLAYLAVFAVTVASFVHLYEEPTLAERYGPSYERYCREVPRWLPRPGR